MKFLINFCLVIYGIVAMMVTVPIGFLASFLWTGLCIGFDGGQRFMEKKKPEKGSQ